MMGMGGGGLGRAVVEILGNDAELKAVLAEDEAALKSFSRTGSSSFNGTSKGAALASKAISGVGIAAAATIVVGAGMAAQFDKTFAQIGVLAGKIGMPIDQAKQHVLDLAKATGQDPNGLASALYFAGSAGLKASQVMPLLDISAKAAAMGMGSAQDVAKSLTSILNAYAGTGLTAAQAMNVLTVGAKDSSAEMSDFATGLGPVISTAASAGVSINDLVAAIGQVKNAGVPFDRAVTGMRFLISSLTSPTDKATKALDSVGLSADDVAKMLTQPGGLEKALQLIHDRTDAMGSDGRKAWSAITGGARGAIVAVDLVGKHTADTNRIVADLGRSAQQGAKDFSNAWGKISQTDAVKIQQSVADIKVALIQLGEKALPMLTPLIHALSSVLQVVIPLAPAILAVYAAWKSFNAVAMLIANPEFLIALAGVAAGFIAIKAAVDLLRGDTTGWVDAVMPSGKISAFTAKMAIASSGVREMALAQRTLGRTVPNFTVAQAKQNAQWAAAVPILTILSAQGKSTGLAMGGLAGATKGAGAAAKSATGPTNALAAASRNAAAAAQSQFLAEETLAGGVLGIVAADQQAKSGEQTLAKLRATGKQGTLEYSQAVQQQAGNVLALAVAVSNYEKDNKGATGSMQAQLGPLSALFSKYGITKAMLEQLAGSAANAKSQVDGVASSVNNLPSSKTIDINIVTHYHTIGSPPGPGKPLP